MKLSRKFTLPGLVISVAAMVVNWSALARADEKLIAGADISMLPEIEKAGGVFRENGEPGDAIEILKIMACNLFRIRLFVNPIHDYAKSWGATQDLEYVRKLAKRVKASGQKFLLDIHYSDTWADPSHQFTPAAWKDLDFEAMKKQVGDYTKAVLSDLQDEWCSAGYGAGGE